MVVVMAAAPPNDTGDNRTSSDATGNEKVMANEGSGRRLLWWGSLDGVEPVVHASRKVEERSTLPTGRLFLHHPKT